MYSSEAAGPRSARARRWQRTNRSETGKNISAPQPVLSPMLPRGARSPLPRETKRWQRAPARAEIQDMTGLHAATRGQVIKCSCRTSKCTAWHATEAMLRSQRSQNATCSSSSVRSLPEPDKPARTSAAEASLFHFFWRDVLKGELRKDQAWSDAWP